MNLIATEIQKAELVTASEESVASADLREIDALTVETEVIGEGIQVASAVTQLSVLREFPSAISTAESATVVAPQASVQIDILRPLETLPSAVPTPVEPEFIVSLVDTTVPVSYYGGLQGTAWKINKWVNGVKTVATVGNNPSMGNLNAAWTTRVSLTYTSI